MANTTFDAASASGNEGILPSQIFGPSKREEIAKNNAALAQKVSDTIIRELHQSPNISSHDLKNRIVELSAENIDVAFESLKLLKKSTQISPSMQAVEQVDDELKKEAKTNVAKESLKQFEYLSPKEVSLREGVLPEIPANQRMFIEKFLNAEISLEEVANGLNINASNAREILKAIKIIDLELDRLTPEERKHYKHSTYPLRTLCMQLSDSTIPTFEAYTKSIDLKYFSNPFAPAAREYANHSYNYIPERVREHMKLVNNYAIDMMALSKRLATDRRTFFCIGGNTGVGKSFLAKSDPEYKKGLLNEQMTGALNPDNVKGMLRKNIPRVTNQQAHVEGFAIAQKAAAELKSKAIEASIIIDERLGVPDVVRPIMQLSQTTNTSVKYKDLEGPLLVSCLRVLTRDTATDPCVPFQPIADGYRIIRKKRKEIIQLMKDSPQSTYQLYVIDKSGKQKLAAEKKDGEFVVHDEKLLNAVCEVDENEIDQVKNTLLTDEYIDNINYPGVNAKSKEALRKYIGKTIAQALDLHSKEPPLQNKKLY